MPDEFKPKVLREIRRKRLELMRCAEDARSAPHQTIWLPGQDPNEKQDPEVLMFGAACMAWVLGEEMLPPHLWKHEAPHARGWEVIPADQKEYTEKPDW